MRFSVLFVGFITMFCALPLRADLFEEAYSGTNFKKLCVEEKDFCAGWVAGMAQGIEVAEAHSIVINKQKLSLPYCFPIGVTSAKRIEVFIEFLENNPAKLHENVHSIYLDAMSEKWPCSE